MSKPKKPKQAPLFPLVDPAFAHDVRPHERAEFRDSIPPDVYDSPRGPAIKLGQRKRKRVGPHR